MQITEQSVIDVVQRLGDSAHDVALNLFEAGFLAQVTDPYAHRQFALEAYLEDVLNGMGKVYAVVQPVYQFEVHVAVFKDGDRTSVKTKVPTKGVYDFLTGNGR